MNKSYKFPHGGICQSVTKLRRRETTMKLTGTDGRMDGKDHILSQDDALTKNLLNQINQLKIVDTYLSLLIA